MESLKCLCVLFIGLMLNSVNCDVGLNIAKKSPQQQQQQTQPQMEEIRDLHELVRAVLERNVSPFINQIISGLNVPSLFGESSEAPPVTVPSVPLTSTPKQYIYLYLQQANATPETVEVAVEGLFKNSADGNPISPTVSTSTTKRSKYRVNRNKTIATSAPDKNIVVEDDEDESDVLKKIDTLPQ